MIDTIYDLVRNLLSFLNTTPKFYVRSQHNVMDINATSLGITTFITNKASKVHNIIKIIGILEENPNYKIEINSIDPRLPIRLEPNDAEKMVRFFAQIGRLSQDKVFTLKITLFAWWKNKEVEAGHTKITLCRPG